MEKEKNIPRLRFPDYKGEWLDTKLKDLVSFRNGKAHEQNIVIDGKYIVVNSKFISRDGEVRKYSDKQISPVELNEILMVMSDVPNGKSLAKCFLVDADNKYTLNQRICALKVKDAEAGFLFYILNRNKYYLSFDSGVGQTNLTIDEVLNCPLTIPASISEQTKIRNFLSEIEKKLQYLKKRKFYLEQYRKGILQKIFSQGIRFKDKNGKDYPEWEQKKYGDIFSFRTTNSYSRENLNYEQGEIKNIHYGDIHTKFKTLFDITEENLPFINSDIDLHRISNDNYCKEGDLIVADASEDYADVGKCIEVVNLNSERVLAGLHTILARPDLYAMSVGFNGYLMQSEYVRQQIKIIAQGSKVLSISSKRLAEIKLNIPSIPEQKKISSFLSAIDRKVEKCTIQIEQTELYKKGLLQKMFC